MPQDTSQYFLFIFAIVLAFMDDQTHIKMLTNRTTLYHLKHGPSQNRAEFLDRLCSVEYQNNIYIQQKPAQTDRTNGLGILRHTKTNNNVQKM